MKLLITGGAYQYPEKLIPLFIIKSIKDEKLPLYGDGQNVRDWIHVQDYCRAVELVLKKGEQGKVYNVGGNNEKTNLEITKKILEILEKPESLIEFVQDRPGHDYRYAIDYSRIKKELGWEPQINFEKGSKKTVEWYVENRKWWEKLIRNKKEINCNKN